jgi:hypothetical protein
MWAGESERTETWSSFYTFLRAALGDSLNNLFGTGIMDENTAGMRSFAKLLELMELFRCAEHRGTGFSRGGAKGDKRRYKMFAEAPTLALQDKILAGLSAGMLDKINKAPPEEQSLASKTRDGYGETTSNAIESTWHMIYAVRRANLGKALMVVARLHADRIQGLKKAAADWPHFEPLTPRAKADLARLGEESLSLNMVVVDDYKTGRGTVKSPTDLGPIAVDASKLECAKCGTKRACVHLVRIVQASGAACNVSVNDLYPYYETSGPWKKMWLEMPFERPNFALLVEARDERARSLKLGSGGRAKPGATRVLRIKNSMELRFLRGLSRRARAAAGEVNPHASRVPSPAKGPQDNGDARRPPRSRKSSTASTSPRSPS